MNIEQINQYQKAKDRYQAAKDAINANLNVFIKLYDSEGAEIDIQSIVLQKVETLNPIEGEITEPIKVACFNFIEALVDALDEKIDESQQLIDQYSCGEDLSDLVFTITDDLTLLEISDDYKPEGASIQDDRLIDKVALYLKRTRSGVTTTFPQSDVSINAATGELSTDGTIGTFAAGDIVKVYFTNV